MMPPLGKFRKALRDLVADEIAAGTSGKQLAAELLRATGVMIATMPSCTEDELMSFILVNIENGNKTAVRAVEAEYGDWATTLAAGRA